MFVLVFIPYPALVSEATVKNDVGVVNTWGSDDGAAITRGIDFNGAAGGIGYHKTVAAVAGAGGPSCRIFGRGGVKSRNGRNENGHVESVSKEGWELVCANEIKQFSTGYKNFYWKRLS